MKVAMVNLEHPTYVGGRQSYIATMMEYLSKKVEYINSISVQPNIDLKKTIFDQPNIKEFLLAIPPCLNSDTYFNLFIRKAENSLQRMYIHEPIDVIHAHGVVDAHAAIKVKKKYDVPLVLTIHSPPPPEEEFWLNNIKKYADAVIVLSEYMKSWAVNTGFPKNKVFVIKGFIDFKLFDPSINADDIAKKLKINPSDKIIFCPARFSPIKGIHILLRSMANIIKEEGNCHCKILLTGKGSSPELLLDHKKNEVKNYVKSLIDLIEKLHLWPNIVGGKNSLEYGNMPRFSYKEMPKLFNISTVTVYPSLDVPYGEPFGLVVLESMRMMTPIIASNNGGMSEIIKDCETGLLFPSENIDALTKRINILLSNNNLKHNIIQKAKNEVLKYDTEIMIDKHMELYRNITSI